VHATRTSFAHITKNNKSGHNLSLTVVDIWCCEHHSAFYISVMFSFKREVYFNFNFNIQAFYTVDTQHV